MYIELMAIQHVLKHWLQTPDAPIRETSLCYGEQRNRPYTEAEIRKMRDFLNAIHSGRTSGFSTGTDPTYLLTLRSCTSGNRFHFTDYGKRRLGQYSAHNCLAWVRSDTQTVV
jgi:hypothetical protein